MSKRIKLLWLATVLAIFFVIFGLLFVRKYIPENMNIITDKHPYNQHEIQKKEGCFHLVEEFCQTLWSADHLGKIDLTVGGESIVIRLGEEKNTYDSGFDQYLKTILENRKSLPKDFLEEISISDNEFFQNLELVLQFDRDHPHSNEEILTVKRTRLEVALEWDNALKITANRRLENEFPGAIKQSVISLPDNMRNEKEVIQGKLQAEIHQILWAKNPAWLRVLNKAEEVRKNYLEFLNENTHINSTAKKKWRERISTVQFEPPGTDPEDTDEDCRSGAINAYYHPIKHVVRICTGYFDNASVYRVVAHELSHSIAFQKYQQEIWKNSVYNKSFEVLREKSCSEHKPNCNEWSDWKQQFSTLLAQIAKEEVPGISLMRCLQKPVSHDLTPDQINLFAKKIAIRELDYMASNNQFLDLVAETKKDNLGNAYKNPYYLNPCNTPWPDLDHLNSKEQLSTFFLNEFLCNTNKNPKQKMVQAISQASEMYSQFLKVELGLSGKLSSREMLQKEGFASDSEEMFADWMGEEVLSRILKKIPAIQDRRNLFMATMATQCDPPSLANDYPEYFQAQKKFYFDPHSEAAQRRKELLTKSIRQALQCEKDFEVKECSLPSSLSNN